MAKLRKMLGSPNSLYVVSIRQLMETQSKTTLAQWCLDYARTEVLPIYKKAYPEDTRGELALDAAARWLTGELKLPQVKKQILSAHGAAREAEGDPAAQAAMRAVAQASSVIHVPSHALGLVYYGTAALAYAHLGINQSEETYDQAAAKASSRMEESLRSVSVKDELHPVLFK